MKGRAWKQLLPAAGWRPLQLSRCPQLGHSTAQPHCLEKGCGVCVSWGTSQQVHGVPGYPLTPPCSMHPADPRAAKEVSQPGPLQGHGSASPKHIATGTRFPSCSVSSAPGAPLLEPIPLSTSTSLVCLPQAQSRFLGREGRALHGVPSPPQPWGAATCLSVFLSSPACRQQLARQGQPPNSHHVQVPARLQQQQQLSGLAPLHQRQGKAVPTAAFLRPGKGVTQP